MPGLALIGNLVKDVVAGAPPRPGGAVYYQARALAVTGRAAGVRAVTRCAGADRTALLEPLERFGLPVAWQSGSETQAFSFHYEGEHRIMNVTALGDPWTAADVEGWAGEAIGDAGWIVLGALTRADFSPRALAALRTGGRRLLVDAQGLVRLGRLGPLRIDGALHPEQLLGVQALKLNEVEAGILARSTEPEALRQLGVPEVVLTLGSQGAVVVTSSLAEHVPAETIDGPVDPTGAGDTFWIVYLTARRDGAEPVEAARVATVATSRLLTGEL